MPDPHSSQPPTLTANGPAGTASLPTTQRIHFRDRAAFVLPVLVAAALALTNRWFLAVDDECAIIDQAARPAGETLRVFLSGAGQHEHPPLYDLILHGWLRLTGGAMPLLRAPAILFYALGMWALAAAAKRLAGESAGTWTLVLVALWPFGFHFGRLAAWYSFCFFLVALLTAVYLRYVERPTLKNWSLVILCTLLLVYSNYFGWAFLGLLVFDLALRDPKGLLRHGARLVAGGALLVVAYLPVVAAFVGELHRGVHTSHSFFGLAFTGVYNLYCAFVSESVAPWFWALGVPAGLAIAACLIVTLWTAPLAAKRFLIGFVLLLGVLTLLGVAETKRTLLIAPWLVLPVAAALAALPAGAARRLLLASLAVVAAIGWYGIFARNLYAAPHWVEPWDKIAQSAAAVARQGGVVVGNNEPFFFYMTYALPQPAGDSGFQGLLPLSTRRQNVYDPNQWLAEGTPLRPEVLLVRGLHYGTPETPTEETEQLLNRRCTQRSAQKLVPDPGAAWKQRFAPDTGQLPWRIQIEAYQCPSN